MVQNNTGEKKARNAFSKLDPSGVIIRCEELGEEKGLLSFWEKGKPQASNSHSAQVNSFRRDSFAFGMVLESSQQIKFDAIYCFNFNIKGRFFFGTGKFFNSLNQNEYSLNISEDLFRCERRSSYRFQKTDADTITELKIHFPNHPDFKRMNVVELSIPAKQVPAAETVNSLNEELKTYNDFKDLAIREFSPLLSSSNRVFQILDFSVTGVAVLISEYELDYLTLNKIVSNIEIHFTYENVRDVFKIPAAKIINVGAYKSSIRPETKIFKVGMQFLNVPEEMSAAISRKINSTLRDDDLKWSFEEFMK